MSGYPDQDFIISAAVFAMLTAFLLGLLFLFINILPWVIHYSCLYAFFDPPLSVCGGL